VGMQCHFCFPVKHKGGFLTDLFHFRSCWCHSRCPLLRRVIKQVEQVEYSINDFDIFHHLVLGALI
jgi:hypothetical protein